jgi:hypothetical protein
VPIKVFFINGFNDFKKLSEQGILTAEDNRNTQYLSAFPLRPPRLCGEDAFKVRIINAH